MALTRAETQTYFLKFGITLDTAPNRLNCFKCGKDLIYVSTTIGYRCANLHSYTFVLMLNTHAEFKASLVQNLADDKTNDT